MASVSQSDHPAPNRMMDMLHRTQAQPGRERGLSVYEGEDEYTCCGECGLCSPCIGDINVTEPIFCCPLFTYANIFWLITACMLTLLCYGVLYMYLGEPMEPFKGALSGLYILIVFAYFLGWSLTYIPYLHLPPVFGMLLAGIIMRYFDWYNIQDALGVTPSSKVRTFAVTFMMLRAGLQLTSTALREHPFSVLQLAVVPCTMEMIAVAVCSYIILEYPWSWSFLTGSIIACISPVVPVNCILALADRGYGEDKEIATLLFTAASIDDIHIVSLYSIFFSFVFTQDDIISHWWAYVPGGIRDLIYGAAIGALLGIFFIFFPHRTQKNLLWYRLSGLVLGSLMCTSATTTLWITGGGFLATIIMSLIATTGWRILTVPYDVQPLRKAVHVMWHFMQPVLAGVIGADIDLKGWTASRFGEHLAVLAICTVIRMVFAYYATSHLPYNFQERIFIALSWISKGTLQAALAPMTLEQAKSLDRKDAEELAEDVVKISVLAIMILAPLGSIVMMMSGPLLLTKSTGEETRKRRELSYIRLLSLQPVRRQRNSPQTR